MADLAVPGEGVCSEVQRGCKSEALGYFDRFSVLSLRSTCLHDPTCCSAGGTPILKSVATKHCLGFREKPC